MRTKKLSLLKLMTIVAIGAAVLFCSVFFLINYLNRDVYVYSTISNVVPDEKHQNYFENSNDFLYFNKYFSDEIAPFILTSKTITEKYNYYLPNFLHIKITSKQSKELKKLVENYKKAESDFKDLKKDFNNELISYNSSQTALPASVKSSFFSTFLSRYIRLIETKQNLSLFLEKELSKSSLLNNYVLNIFKVQNTIIDYSIKFVLPSISINMENNNDFEKILTDSNILSLTKLNSAFNNYKINNVIEIDKNSIKAFEDEFLNLNKFYEATIAVYNNLSSLERHTFLTSEKLFLPDETENSASYNFVLEVLSSNGTLVSMLSNSFAIYNYFNI